MQTAVDKFWRMLNSSFARYLIIGVTVYILEVCLLLAMDVRGFAPTVAVAVSYTVGLIVSFLLQKVVTFGNKRFHHRIVAKQFIMTCLLVVWNLVFTVIVAKVLESIVEPFISRTIALAITTLWNFYLYKKAIFAKPEDLR